MRPSFLVFAAALFSIGPCLAAETFVGVPEISDADTVLIDGHRLRLAGADAPETDQVCLGEKGETYACGVVARQAIERDFGRREWRCEQVAFDGKWGRPVTDCTVGGVNVSQWLIAHGWALGDTRYKHPWDADQERARKAMLGMWSGSFHAPWDWRHHTCGTKIYGAFAVPIDARAKLCPKEDSPPDPACVIKGNLRSKGGCVFHEPHDGAYYKLDMSKPGHRWFCTEADAIGAGCRRAFR